MTFAKNVPTECQKFAETEMNQHSGKTLATHLESLQYKNPIPHTPRSQLDVLQTFIYTSIVVNNTNFLLQAPVRRRMITLTQSKC